MSPTLQFPVELLLRAQGIRVVFFDVDGVLTDCGLFFTEYGETIKRFNTLDGHGLKLLQKAGITPAVNGGNATGTINGAAMGASSWILTAGAGNNADGLSLQILSAAPSTATITINQGLGGVLQAIHDTLLGTTGALTTLAASLTTQQTSLADALTKADAQVTVYHDRLVTQFTQMNTLVSGYKATSSYLTQQVGLWTNPNAS